MQARHGIVWAVAVIGAKSEPRITLTYPTLDSSRDVAFLVTGKEKREVVARALVLVTDRGGEGLRRA